MFFLMLSKIGFSQFNYQAANAVVASGTYTDLGTSGTAISAKFNGGGPITYDDDTSSVQSIGFNFVYNGTTFTQFVLCTNGYIKLGNTAPASMYDVLTAFEANVIAPYNFDLDGGTSPEYRVATTGSAGSRICTIQFKNVKDYSATTGQYTNMNFQIKLYEGTNNIEFVYGTFTASAAASAILGATVGITGSVVASSVNATKASTTAWSSATYINGAYTGNKFNNRNSVLPTGGQIYRFVAVSLPPNDAAVVNVFTLGKRPAGFGGTHAIQATVRNAGSNTLTNLAVTLNVTGANTFTNTQTVASLAPGVSATVTFAGFNPTAVGVNTVTVSVPTDDVTTNNSVAVTQTITSNTISTAYSATATLGVGLNGASGEFATKFTNASSKVIDQISLYFPTTSTGQPYTVVIYDATGAGGTPGTALWTSTSQTTAGANVNLPVSPATTVSGDFFIGVQQTGTTNMALGYETENPVRAGVFYLKTTGTWGDFSASGNNFKIMVDVRFSGGLPVTFSSFAGTKQANNHILSWTTATEINNAGFELQRSVDGTNFTTLANIASKAANGNSNGNLTYAFTDDKPVTGKNYYRLKQNDKDGKFSYSSIVMLELNGKGQFVLNQNYPNPVKGTTQFSYQLNAEGKVTIDLFTQEGKKVGTLVNAQQGIGSYNLYVDINKLGLAAGNYVYRMVVANPSNQTVFQASKTLTVVQ